MIQKCNNSPLESERIKRLTIKSFLLASKKFQATTYTASPECKFWHSPLSPLPPPPWPLTPVETTNLERWQSPGGRPSAELPGQPAPWPASCYVQSPTTIKHTVSTVRHWPHTTTLYTCTSKRKGYVNVYTTSKWSVTQKSCSIKMNDSNFEVWILVLKLRYFISLLCLYWYLLLYSWWSSWGQVNVPSFTIQDNTKSYSVITQRATLLGRAY